MSPAPGLRALVDAHCHLNSGRLGAPVDEVVAEARAVGVETFVLAGVAPEEWRDQRALAARYPGAVFPVFGLHPQWIAEVDEAAVADGLAALERELAGAAPPVALGETGLDGLTPARKASLALQEGAFREHLRLSARYDTPIVLHLLKATGRALEVLREVGVPPAGGVVHSFGGAPEVALAYVKMGLHVSFCGSLTYPQSRRLVAAAAALPLDRVLIETDTPDQAPHPHRGEVNRPALLPLVLHALAEARGEPVAHVAEATAANARRLYRLPG